MRPHTVATIAALWLVSLVGAGVGTPARAQPPGPEEPGQNAIFYPYIPNGVDIEEGNGPWFGVITVQNLEGVAVDIEILEPGTGDVLATATLNAHASKTFPASALGIAEGTAGAASVVARFRDLDPVIASGQCAAEVFTLTRARDADSTDTFSSAPPFATPDRARVPGFTLNTDYTVTISGSDVTIDWSPAGDEPEAGDSYTVLVWDCPTPRISGTEKHASVDLSPAGRTDKDTVAVTGYTALPLSDLALSRGLPADSLLDDVLGETGQWNWAFPIVQTNNGWNSVIHVTNFSDVDNCGVTVIFYESPSGYSDPSFGSFTTTLDAGEMVDVDVLKQGFPTGVNDWVGQAWVSADCPVAATVDRLKDETDMALTLIAQPRVDTGDYNKYGPLVYENFNGWNTGITLANLSDTDANTVTVSFYNQAGQLVSSEQRVLQPRAVEYIYRPSTADVGTGGVVSDLQQVVVSGTAPLAAAADSVKYRGDRLEGQGQALSYLLQGGAFQGETLSVPLIQKGTSLAPSGQFSGDTSGVQLFNASPTTPATVEYAFYDQTGALVAPTLTGPVAVTIGALGAATLYTPFFGEMPAGFQGSFVATVVSGGPVAAVSNNVDYDVVGDGTAAYNAVVSTLLSSGLAELTLTQEETTNPIGMAHTVTASVRQGGEPVEGAVVLFEVESEGTPAPASGAAVTDESGLATFTYTNMSEGTDAISACVDRDGDGALTSGDTCVTMLKTWIRADLQVDLECDELFDGGDGPPVCIDTVRTEHRFTATATGPGGVPLPGVPVRARFEWGANAALPITCGMTGQDGQATCSYTDTYAHLGLFDDLVTVWLDLDGDGAPDDWEPRAQHLVRWLVAIQFATDCWGTGLAGECVELRGTSTTVTATVRGFSGTPVTGLPLYLKVFEGPNQGLDVPCGPTGQDGQASCTYESVGFGRDSVFVCVDLLPDGILDPTIDVCSFRLVAWSAAMVIDLPCPSGQDGECHGVTGTFYLGTVTLTDDSGPVAGIGLRCDYEFDADTQAAGVCSFDSNMMYTDSNGQRIFSLSSQSAGASRTIFWSDLDGDGTRATWEPQETLHWRWCPAGCQ